ncbi:MAG: 4-hydroxy-tetrahydrodipicolinate synthase [Elusimicrobia bacterium]|nr:4-hydroxy-tetrahydrodipicolinate synthase [Elusimicrobiota bacterium]
MRFAGSYVALATPFTKGGGLDEAALRRLVRGHLRAGTAGLVPCGSTGEAATLTHEEYRRVLTLTLEESRGLLPVIAGVGTNATARAVELAREAESLGADALLVLSPYYNKPTQEGLYQHFRAVARNTRLPVVVYNIPGRTAVNISPKTLLRIAADCPNVSAVKEASGNIDQASEIVAGAAKGFAVLSGDDSLTVPMMAVGAAGVISVVANVAPKQTAALCAAALAGDFRKARGLHLKLFGLIKALFVETNPIPVKAALEMMGLCGGTPRLPLTALTAANRVLLRRELAACGLI